MLISEREYAFDYYISTLKSREGEAIGPFMHSFTQMMDWQSDRAAVMSGIKELKQEGGYTSAKAGCSVPGDHAVLRMIKRCHKLVATRVVR